MPDGGELGVGNNTPAQDTCPKLGGRPECQLAARSKVGDGVDRFFTVAGLPAVRVAAPVCRCGVDTVNPHAGQVAGYAGGIDAAHFDVGCFHRFAFLNTSLVSANGNFAKGRRNPFGCPPLPQQQAPEARQPIAPRAAFTFGGGLKVGGGFKHQPDTDCCVGG